MMYLRYSYWRLALALAVLAMAGCSSDPDKPYPVRGVILFEDGQPAKELAGGSVTFTPIPQEEGRRLSSGSIEEDGTFILSCKKEGDGAVAGKHRAVIEPPEREGEDDDAPRRRPLKAILDPKTAVQEVTVEPKSNQITLKVKRAGPSTR
jgi:hypothetical protein